MSYTVYVEVDDIEDVWHRNYTSNVSWMWAESLALPEKKLYRNGNPASDEHGTLAQNTCTIMRPHVSDNQCTPHH